MIPTDDDRSTYDTLPDEFIESDAGFVALAVAQPADPGRQALKVDSLPGQSHPSLQGGVVGKQTDNGRIGCCDVGRVRSAECGNEACDARRLDLGLH